MYTKKCAKFCEVCAHFSLASWYYINRKKPAYPAGFFTVLKYHYCLRYFQQ